MDRVGRFLDPLQPEFQKMNGCEEFPEGNVRVGDRISIDFIVTRSVLKPKRASQTAPSNLKITFAIETHFSRTNTLLPPLEGPAIKHLLLFALLTLSLTLLHCSVDANNQNQKTHKK
jgi:hypothetical protein